MNAISQYAIDQTKVPFVVEKFSNYINQANSKWEDYQKIENDSKNLQLIQNHQNKIANGIKDISLSTQITHAYQDERNNTILLAWLNRLKTWSIDAYGFIMDFRSFVTQGQSFIYHVMSANQTISYHLNQEHFIQLLTGNLKVGKDDWQDLSKVDFSAMLKLSVADPAAKKLGRLKKKEGELKVRLGKDALYEYLSQNVAELETNRLYEMYSQFREGIEWKISKSGRVIKPKFGNKFFFSQERQNWVDEHIEKYLSSSGLKQDNIRFYKTGDSISKDGTLIENKLGGSAAVSISTIKNGIKYIKNLGKKKTGRSLKTRLKELFSYIHPNDPLAQAIQTGAALRARDAIDGIVEALVGGGYIKK